MLSLVVPARHHPKHKLVSVQVKMVKLFKVRAAVKPLPSLEHTQDNLNHKFREHPSKIMLYFSAQCILQ